MMFCIIPRRIVVCILAWQESRTSILAQIVLSNSQTATYTSWLFVESAKICYIDRFFFRWHNSPPVGQGILITRFLDHTQRCTTFGRTSLDEWLARGRDLHLTTNIRAPGGIRTQISACELPQTHAVDCAATDTHKTLKFASPCIIIQFN